MLLKTRTVLIKPFLVLILLASPAMPQPFEQGAARHSTLAFSVDEQGIITAELKLLAPQQVNSTDSSATLKNGLLVVILPIAMDSTARINSGSSTRIAPIHSARSFTILAVICPPGTSEVDLRIDGISHIIETAEGKAKIELDFAYAAMSAAERALLDLPVTISTFDTSIVLPKKFDETEVNYDRSLLSTTDGQSFTLTAQKNKASGVSRLWIVFPSPLKGNLDKAILVLVFLISSFGLFFHSEAFKERRIKWSVGVLVSSLIVLGLTVYFTLTLAKRIEFLTVASASIPQLIYGIIASIYLIFATRYQVTILGQVTIDGKLTELVEVTLYRVQSGNAVKIVNTKSLKNGKYTFHIWPKKPTDHYQISAKSQYSSEGVTPEFSASRGEQSEAPPLDLKSLVIKDSGSKTGLPVKP